MYILVSLIGMNRKAKKGLSRTYALIHNGLKKFQMKKLKISAGRKVGAYSADIQLDSFLISRRHIELTWFAGRLFLRCLGKNGIYINESFRKPGSTLYRLPRRY